MWFQTKDSAAFGPIEFFKSKLIPLPCFDNHKTIHVKGLEDGSQKVYNIFHLSEKEVREFEEKADFKKVRGSGWYRDLDLIPTVYSWIRFLPTPIGQRIHEKKGKHCIIIPCQESDSGLLFVSREIREIMSYISSAIDRYQLSDELLSKVENFSSNNSGDIEITHGKLFVPTVIAVSRYSSLVERKLRRLDIPEFASTLIRAFEGEGATENEYVRLIVNPMNAIQCGLYFAGLTFNDVLESAEELSRSPLKKIFIKWKELKDQLTKVSHMDPLVCDLLTASNDRFSLREWGPRMDLLRVSQRGHQIGIKQGVDAKILEIILTEVLNDPRVSKDLTVGLEQENDKIVKIAKQYLFSLLNNGVLSDNPRQFVNRWGMRYHLIDEGNGKFKAFRTRVRRINAENGYFAKHGSPWIWISFILGGAIFLSFILIRIQSTSSLEDILGTGVSLVALYIALVSPIIFQMIYKDERLLTIVNGLKSVDSQREFDQCKHFQLTDTVEIIRNSKDPPKFLGGENMSYVSCDSNRYPFNCNNPIYFSNLDLAGYSLYESKDGDLYMIDKWFGVYEVVIGQKLNENLLNWRADNTESPPNEYMYIEEKRRKIFEKKTWDFVKNNRVSLYCNAKPELKYETEFDPTNDDGHIKVDGPKTSLKLYRLLPYGIRYRRFQKRSWRLFAVEDSWTLFSNSIIFKMKIGSFWDP